MTLESIRDLLAREPFQPLRIVMSSGEAFIINRPGTVMPLKTDLFVALDDGEHFRFLPYLHIATIASANGHVRPRRKQR